jgi:EmrB/QacA subfamily drug resistance transporter
VQERPATRGDKRLIAIATLAATFLIGLDTSIIATAMPTVVAQLGGVHLYAWVFSGYLLTSTVTVPIYGKLADLYGRKPIFLVATGIFLLGSMLCGQAQTMEQLIAFRLLQGLGAGLQAVVFTIVGDVYPLEERARMNGIFSATWSLAAILGPSVGGFLTEQVDWRWVFYVNLPFCLLAMGLVWRFLHERVVRRPHQIDYVGSVLLAATVGAFLFGLQDGQGALRALLLAAAAVGLGLFVWHEARAAEPILPPGLFRRRIISASLLGGFFMGMLLFTQGSFVPPYVQGVMGASPLLAGLVLAGTSIGWPAGSVLSGRIIIRWGYRAAGLAGGVLLVLGSVWLRLLRPDDSLWVATGTQVVLGVGFGFLSAVTLISVQNAVSWEQRGVVTSASQFARSMGGTLGVSVAGAVFAAAIAATLAGADPGALLTAEGRATIPPALLAEQRDALAGALRAVFTLGMGVAAAALVSLAFLPGGKPESHGWQAAPGRAAASPERERVGAGR